MDDWDEDSEDDSLERQSSDSEESCSNDYKALAGSQNPDSGTIPGIDSAVSVKTMSQKISSPKNELFLDTYLANAVTQKTCPPNKSFNWDLAPDGQPPSDVERHRRETACSRLMEIAASLRKEKQARQQQRQRKRDPHASVKWALQKRQRNKDPCTQAARDNANFTKLFPSSPGSVCVGPAQVVKHRQPVIIFDWDDTLFPTWHVTQVIQPCLETRSSALPEGSIFNKPMEEYAKLVEQVLTVACSVAKVYIVTLGRRPWVEDSSESFLPGVDIPSLLKKFGVRIFYAREHLGTHDVSMASDEDGVNPFMVAKRNAMKKCLKKARRQSGLKSVNAIAIGDSQAEIEAMQDLIWCDGTGEDLCKTVNFLSDPNLNALTSQLNILLSWMAPLLAYDKDIDISMQKIDVPEIQKLLRV